MDTLVSAEWLLREASASDVRIVDATLFLPTHNRDARQEFAAGHIPGAVFLDMHEVCDPDSGLPFTLPSARRFASKAQALGLGDDSRIIVYDNSPMHTAARAWWMLQIFGVDQVAVLDGGLAAWKAAGGKLESGNPSVRHRQFTVWSDTRTVKGLTDMRELVASGGVQIIDARSPESFAGKQAGTTPGLRAGHMPGARNLPFSRLYTADGHMKDRNALRQAFADAGIDPLKPLVASCGSGITACSIVLAATILGAEEPGLYDGSWAEWGAQPDTPVVTGA